MADFKTALTNGLRANADAVAKKNEIHAVVRDVSDQISEATGGVIAFQIVPRVRNVVRHFTNRLALAMGLEEQQKEEVPYLQLTAVRRQPPASTAALGEIEIDDAGYPVYIRSGKAVSETAWDRESLERALTSLIQHPNTGNQIQELLDMKAAPGWQCGVSSVAQPCSSRDRSERGQ